jgi:uncharacterized phage protein (TIGR02218 family)
MKQIPAALEEHLKSRATTLCTCWRILRKDGVSICFTDHDDDLEFDGFVFQANTGAQGSEAEVQTGFGTDNSEFSGALTSDSLTAIDIANGVYDRALVQSWLVNWQDPEQRTLTAFGEIGTLKKIDGAWQAELRGAGDQLSEVRGRRYSRRCDAQLGDARCGVVLTSPLIADETVIDVVNGRAIVSAQTQQPDGFYSGGKLLVLANGTPTGVELEIRHHEISSGQSSLSFWSEKPIALETGTPIRLITGCDKSHETCRKKFSNSLNFRGFPHIPGNDFALSPAKEGVVHDGSPLVTEDD